MDLSLSAAYSSGESMMLVEEPQFTTYTGDARLRIAVNTHWATYFEYLLYYYQFGQGVRLPLGVPSGLTRSGLRIGLTAWLPVRHK
jgi:hypothetical protein